eukprot:363688-Chlamydomonas_euryale.AAC.7
MFPCGRQPDARPLGLVAGALRWAAANHAGSCSTCSMHQLLGSVGLQPAGGAMQQQQPLGGGGLQQHSNGGAMQQQQQPLDGGGMQQHPADVAM